MGIDYVFLCDVVCPREQRGAFCESVWHSAQS